MQKLTSDLTGDGKNVDFEVTEKSTSTESSNKITVPDSQPKINIKLTNQAAKSHLRHDQT